MVHHNLFCRLNLIKQLKTNSLTLKYVRLPHDKQLVGIAHLGWKWQACSSLAVLTITKRSLPSTCSLFCFLLHQELPTDQPK